MLTIGIRLRLFGLHAQLQFDLDILRLRVHSGDAGGEPAQSAEVPFLMHSCNVLGLQGLRPAAFDFKERQGCEPER